MRLSHSRRFHRDGECGIARVRNRCMNFSDNPLIVSVVLLKRGKDVEGEVVFVFIIHGRYPSKRHRTFFECVRSQLILVADTPVKMLFSLNENVEAPTRRPTL